MGLAIAAKLVLLMGGQIWVESPWPEPRSNRTIEGSAFHFTARFARGAQTVSLLTRLITNHCGRPLRIVVAEDNAVNRCLLSQLLTKRGHTVVTAENGAEAIAAICRETVDLVLMDVQMPEMDGLTAARATRNRENGGRRLPIVALTAHAISGDREECLAAGMDDYISKPIRVEELERVLLQVASGIPLEHTASG